LEKSEASGGDRVVGGRGGGGPGAGLTLASRLAAPAPRTAGRAPPGPGAMLWSFAAGPLVNVVLLPDRIIAQFGPSRGVTAVVFAPVAMFQMRRSPPLWKVSRCVR